MTYFVATARTHYEFRTADAINDAGGFSVVPRRVEIVKDKTGQASYEYRPFLPNFIFCAMDEDQWFRVQTDRLFWLKPIGETAVRTILPKLRREMDILPRAWDDFQGFAERAERACDLRIEQWEAGRRIAAYRKGDMIRILGDMLDGQLKDKIAKVLRVQPGMIEAEVDGVTILGKPVKVRLGANDVRGIAAE